MQLVYGREGGRLPSLEIGKDAGGVQTQEEAAEKEEKQGCRLQNQEILAKVDAGQRLDGLGAPKPLIVFRSSAGRRQQMSTNNEVRFSLDMRQKRFNDSLAALSSQNIQRDYPGGLLQLVGKDNNNIRSDSVEIESYDRQLI